MDGRKRLPDAELSVMQAVWAHGGEVSRGDIEGALASHGWSVNTINTYLTRLCDKGYLSARREGRSNFYTPLVSQEKYREFDSRSVLQRLYGGSLGSFVAEQNVYNPIKEQEEMFRMATGLDDALYTHLKYDTLEAPDTCDLRASGTSGTQYSYSTQDADGQSELSISYVVPQDGLLVATTKSSGNYDLTVYRNGERLFTRNIKVRCLFSLGCFKAGDTVTLTIYRDGKTFDVKVKLVDTNDIS